MGYNKIAEGKFTGTAATPHFIPLAFMPEQIEIWNKTEWGSANATSQVQYAIGFAEDTAGSAFTTINTSSAATLENDPITSGGFTFFPGGFPVSGPTVTGTVVSQATPAVVTINSHGFVTGDTVWLWGTTGMLQIAGAAYTITKTGSNTFTIPVDSAGFAAAATAVSARLWFGLSLPDTYIPFICNIVAISTGATSTTITTAVSPHKFVVGQEVGFVIPAAWGMTQLDGLKGFVTSISATTLVVDIPSSSFTAFAFPTSAVAARGVTFPQVFAVGDENFGFSGPAVPPITIPGAFTANSTPGVVIGANLITNVSGGGATIAWRAIFPDQFISEA